LAWPFRRRPSLAFNDKQYDYAVISPDGQKIAFTAIYAGRQKYSTSPTSIRPSKAAAGNLRPLEPFWSPDSKSFAFGSQGKLKRVDIAAAIQRSFATPRA
jgi:Tol biopolymer transport system component